MNALNGRKVSCATPLVWGILTAAAWLAVSARAVQAAEVLVEAEGFDGRDRPVGLQGRARAGRGW